MNKKDIKNLAIVTLFGNINIGNKLQNYALQEICKRYSENVTTLTYSEARFYVPIGWKGIAIANLGFPKKLAAQKKAIINRFERFKEFSDRYIVTEKEKPFKEFDDETNRKFQCFITGSDQVWHNHSNTDEEIKYFMLKFADEYKRICCAPSFGFDIIPSGSEKVYSDGLKGFNHLSCREKSGCDIIEKITGKKAQLLPDPTLCLKKNEWVKIEKKPEYDVPEEYILVYLLGDENKNAKERIKDLSKKKKLPIIDIYNLEFPQYYITRPDEFIYLINNAKYVCTNSFHGCVFSIIFHSSFIFFDRNDKEGRRMSSRFSTLFEEFHLKPNNKGIFEDFSFVDDTIEQKKITMISYLNDSVNDVVNYTNIKKRVKNP